MFSGEQVMNDALDLQSQALSLQVAGIKLIAGFEEWWLGPESNRGHEDFQSTVNTEKD